MLFQLVAPFLVKLPRCPQRFQAGRILGNHFGDPCKAAEKTRDVQLQVDQQVIVVFRFLSPADGNAVGVFLAVQSVRQEAGGSKTPQQFIQAARLCLVCRIDEDAVPLLKRLFCCTL